MADDNHVTDKGIDEGTDEFVDNSSLGQIFDNCLQESTTELEHCYKKLESNFSNLSKIRNMIAAIKEDVNFEKTKKEKLLEHSLCEFSSIMHSFNVFPSDVRSHDGEKVDTIIQHDEEQEDGQK